MFKQLLAYATVAASLVLVQAAPAHAAVTPWPIVHGKCINPAGHAIPHHAALHNPHCQFGGGGGGGGGGHGHGHGGHHGHGHKGGAKHAGGHGHSSAAGQYVGAAIACSAVSLIATAWYVAQTQKRELTHSEAYALGLGCFIPILGHWVGYEAGRPYSKIVPIKRRA